MPLYDITLPIIPGEMFCTNCTNTVEQCVKNFLNKSSKTYDSVTASHIKNQVKIERLNLNNVHELRKLLPDVKTAIQDIGFTCANNSPAIKTIDGEIRWDDLDLEQGTSFKNNNNNEQALTHLAISPWVSGSSSLVLGTALMVQEHVGLFESQQSIDLTIGVIATGLTGCIGYNNFRNALQRQGAMDTLISIGAVGAIAYSFLLLTALKDDSSSTFFSVPLMILGFVKLSHALRDSLQAKIEFLSGLNQQQEELLPNKVFVISGNDLCTESVSTVPVGSQIRVEANEILPIDSKILNTCISVSEYFLTGNHAQTTKNPGDTIFAGTQNTTGQPIVLETICKAEDNEIRKVSKILNTKLPRSESIEWLSYHFLHVVLSVATTSALFWGLLGPQPRSDNAIRAFLSVVLSACPCNLGLIGLNASVTKATALEKGILVQNNDLFDFPYSPKNVVVCLDKDGTMTTGEYVVSGIATLDKPTPSLDDKISLSYAIALQQENPKEDHTAVTEAFIKFGKDNTSMDVPFATDFSTNPMNTGRGGRAIVKNKEIVIGNKALLHTHGIEVKKEWEDLEATLAHQGNLAIFLAIDKQISIIVLKPIYENIQELRPDVIATIENLITEGYEIHILSGDSQSRTKNIAEKLVDAIPSIESIEISTSNSSERVKVNSPLQKGKATLYAQTALHPQDKVKYIQELQNKKKFVVMLGDGRNDEGAIQAANLGIVIDGNANSSTRNKAGIILNGKFTALAQVISLIKTYQEAYHASLSTAFGLNSLLVCGAAGVFYPLTHQPMNPMIPGMAMAGSSLLLMLVIAGFQKLGRSRINYLEKDFNKRENSSPRISQVNAIMHHPRKVDELKISLIRSNSF